jgi:transcriptional regulator with XRE-family HTH domain
LRNDLRAEILAPMNVEWHVGDVVRKLRLGKGLTQKQLAEQADVHHNTIVRLEDGDEGVQGRTLARVASALGVTSKELWRLVPEPPHPGEETQRTPAPADVTAGKKFFSR